MKIIQGPPDPQGKGAHDDTIRLAGTEVQLERAERREHEPQHPRSKAKRWYVWLGKRLLGSSSSRSSAIRNATNTLNGQ